MAPTFPEPIYPTNALHFLHRLGRKVGPDDISDPAWQQTAKAAKVQLNIIVVGAGLGGLATSIALARNGHTVRVYEQAPEFGEVGAGIQVPPNSTRYLLAWGVGPHLEPHISEPFAINLRRWEDGSLIGMTRLRPEYREKFGAPYFVIHRKDYHTSLLNRAKELGIYVESNSSVQEYHFRPSSTKDHNQKPVSVTLRDGRILHADLVVAADGVNSVARRVVVSEEDNDKVIPRPIANAAYRGTVDTAKMAADPDTAWLLESPNQNVWMGDDRHCMTYLIGGKNDTKKFNMVLSHPEPNDPSTWKQEEAQEEMKKHFQDWDPQFVKVINMLDQIVKWPLMSGQILQHWVHRSGRLVIVGDAAHAMVPYISQGAAQAIEDAAALAMALSLIENEEQIIDALQIFEDIRKERASQMQQASIINGEMWHFADGPEQRARDASMRPELEGKPFAYSANQWSDPACQMWLYGLEVDKQMERAWDKWIISEKTKVEANGLDKS